MPVTLDNGRSPVRTWFGVTVTPEDDGEFLDPTFNEGLPVAAGVARVVAVPVPRTGKIEVIVDDANQLPGNPLVHEVVDVSCPQVSAGRAGQLAETGASGLTLPIAGLTLLVSGALLTVLGRRQS
jgi:LPXTG-motif cell wall-anchored protein